MGAFRCLKEIREMFQGQEEMYSRKRKLPSVLFDARKRKRTTYTSPTASNVTMRAYIERNVHRICTGEPRSKLPDAMENGVSAAANFQGPGHSHATNPTRHSANRTRAAPMATPTTGSSSDDTHTSSRAT